MDASMVTIGAVTCLVIASSLLLLSTLLGPRRDSNEPPYISPSIPYIGHLIGLLTKKYDYYVNLR